MNNEKIKDEMKENEKHKLNEAKELIEKLSNLKIIFKKEADEKDQLYGSISKKEILDFFSKNQLKVKSDDLLINHRPLPRMIHGKKNIGIELHHQSISNDILKFDDNKIYKKENKNILNIHDSIMLIILNSEVNDRGTLSGRIDLRSKFDFFQLYKLENNYDYNFYTKAFITKMVYLKILEKTKEVNSLYLIYLVLSKYFGLGFFIYEFFINIQRVKNFFKSKKYRIVAFNKIKNKIFK